MRQEYLARLPRDSGWQALNGPQPADLFAHILVEVDGIAKALQETPADEHAPAAFANARQLFGQLSKDLRTQLSALHEHAEWQTFTIAFYGETNAGKSTVIEALRILFAEENKLASQQQFRDLQSVHGNTAERLATLRADLEASGSRVTDAAAAISTLDTTYAVQLQEAQREWDTVASHIAQHEQTASIWQKLLALRRIRSARQHRDALAARIGTLKHMQAAEMASLRERQAARQQESSALDQALAAARAGLASLEEHADGFIIGNGRSDFTRATTPYAIRHGRQCFTLLDIPGIEGHEAAVQDAIQAGVRKAHAVFYVTGKASAPQQGDGQQPGTLDRIRMHLGDHTEVRTLYNKRVTNPMQLAPSALTNQDELASIKVLDEHMHAALGHAYRETLSISAHPAFLGLATCLVPDSAAAASQAKFLAKFSQQELLDKSGIAQLRDLVVRDLVHDYEAKIIRSNFNKARCAVDACINQVSASRVVMASNAQQLAADAVLAHTQLDTARDALESRLGAACERAVTGYVTAVRQSMYKLIDGDISNDQFHAALKNVMTEEQDRLAADLPAALRADIDKFAQHISDIVQRYQTFADELLAAYNGFHPGGIGERLSLRIQLDNGIHVPGLIASVIGGIALIFTPGGVVLAAIGAITVLVGLSKSLWGAVSSDYKKAQQRKAVNANLATAGKTMRERLDSSISAALSGLDTSIAPIRTELGRPAALVASIEQMLGQSKLRLKALASTITPTGNL